jgi:hypothetical protein
MEAVKAANLALRFGLELCVLAAVGYWGATTHLRLAGRVVLAAGAPALVAVVWGFFVAPRAPVDLGPGLRLLVEVLVFTVGVTALLLRHRVALALALAVLYLANRILMAAWRQ